MKKRILTVLSMLVLSFALVAFTACGGKKGKGDGNDGGDSRPQLTLTTNIEAAGTVTGGGHFEYNEDLFINAETNSGYYFLGWYYDNDLISTSAEYNCKMWNKDVTLEAKFTALPKDYNENGSSGNLGDIINTNFKLLVKTDTPLLGKVNVNDAGNKDEYNTTEKSGNNIKVLALTNSSKRFLGWYDDSDNLVMANSVFEFVMPSFDYTLHARWECDEEKLVYDSSTKKYICSVCGGFGAGNEKFAIIDNSEKGKTLVAYLGNDENVTIPSNVNAIAENAFVDAPQIKSVVIPSSVTSIACGAFYGCSSLESITLPLVDDNMNDEYTYPFGHIFGKKSYGGAINIEQRDTNSGRVSKSYYYIPSSLKSVTINGGDICKYAFMNCTSITNVAIVNGVTSIGHSAFSGCTNLASITIGNSVTSIGDSAFSGCENIISVTIGNGVTSIGDSAFSRCTSLTSITIPNSVTSIGNYAFYLCKFEEIIIPHSVTSIGAYAFSNSKLTNVIIPDSVTDMGDNAFFARSQLISATIGNGVTNIGESTFKSCRNLVSVNIGDSVTNIGAVAFEGCKSLTSIVIPNSVTTIGEGSFLACESLSNVTIGNGVTSIGKKAFFNCTNLISIKYRGSASEWSSISKGSSWNKYLSGMNSYTIGYTMTYDYIEEQNNYDS